MQEELAKGERSAGDRDRLALLALVLGALGIGFAPIFVRLADVGPAASAFYRTGLAVPLFLIAPFLPPAPRQRIDMPQSTRELLLLMLSGVFFAGDLGFWHLSIGATSIANATLFTNFAPVIVSLVAWRFFGERITLRFVIGLLVALMGAVLVLGDSLERGGSHFSGDLLAFASALFYAFYLLSVSRLRRLYSTLTLMTWSSLATALVLICVALLSGEIMVPQSAAGVLPLAGLALVSQVGGQGLIAYALAHLPVSFSSLGLLLQPAFATLFAFALLGEPLGALQAAGGGVILAGITLARRRR